MNGPNQRRFGRFPTVPSSGKIGALAVATDALSNFSQGSRATHIN
jgi:hypothetical protein